MSCPGAPVGPVLDFQVLVRPERIVPPCTGCRYHAHDHLLPDARITPSAATIGRTQALIRPVGGPVVRGSDRTLWLQGSGGP
jgi:hypothetical protein